MPVQVRPLVPLFIYAHLKIIDKKNYSFILHLEERKIDVERVMKKTLTFIIAIICLVKPLTAAFLQFSPSAKVAGLSGISLLNETSANIFIDPASLGEGLSFSSSYAIPFSYKGISYKNITASCSTGRFTAGIGIQDFGDEVYKEQTVVVAANAEALKKFTIGIGARYMNDKTKSMDPQTTYQIDLGIRAEHEKLKFSTTFLNITFSKLENDPLPQENRTYISYLIAQNLELGCGFIKEFDYAFSFRVGVAYYPIRNVGFFSGFHTEPNQFTAGMEFQLVGFNIQYAIETHQYLGISHYISIGYEK